MKYSFKNDYAEGAHPRILEALVQSNFTQQNGYGLDDYCKNAENLIQETEDIYQDIMNKMKMILSEEEIESCIHSIDKIKELFK